MVSIHKERTLKIVMKWEIYEFKNHSEIVKFKNHSEMGKFTNLLLKS